ncbi:ester cyclase [Vibrio sp.]|uniref:ester cyclase n=1 Tax=Vibrio sp. TaxID=678 RepID=UPI003D1509BD
MTDIELCKQKISRLNETMYNFDLEKVAIELDSLVSPDAILQYAYPFETLSGKGELIETLYQPLLNAIPDLEKRTYIAMASQIDDSVWVGCGGYYTGSFLEPWLDIPPTGHQMSMRFHEFYRFEGNKIVEIQALWDIPELMLQAGAWPMSRSLGREWHPPAPAHSDGLVQQANPLVTEQSLQTVSDMLTGLAKHAEGGVDAMQLEKYWHPRSSWYGPSGIGTGRGIAGFRNWHQIPFLNALPNRRTKEGNGYLFAEHNYVAFTAWPGMEMTVSGSGWLGIAPANQEITMRSLDFWRVEGDKIRENWVLVDLLHVYAQLGVDVLSRMKELNKARYRQFDK